MKTIELTDEEFKRMAELVKKVVLSGTIDQLDVDYPLWLSIRQKFGISSPDKKKGSSNG